MEKNKILKSITFITYSIFCFIYLIGILVVIFKFTGVPVFANTLTFFMLILIISILTTLYILYKTRLSFKPENIPLVKSKELYPILPYFIISIGLSFIFLRLTFSSVSNILFYLGNTLYGAGIGLLIITLYAKWLLNRRIYFNLKEANNIIKKIDGNNKNPVEIYNLKRRMGLIFKNVNNKLGRGLELRTCNEADSCYKLEYALVNYLPYYINFGGKEQLHSAKRHLEVMFNSVPEDDAIKWKYFTREVMDLNEEIITYLKDINFHLTYRKWPRNLEWVSSNKDMIFKVVGLIVAAIISVVLKIPFGT